MKIDVESENNSRVSGRNLKFIVGSMLIFRPGFYYFLGGIFLLAGIALFINGGSADNEQREKLSHISSSLYAIAVGVIMIGGCKFILYLNAKVKQYKPKENKGGEWGS